MSGATAPKAWGEDFLRWVRTTTEAAWADVVEPDLAAYRARGVGGRHWRRGTCWSGYTDAQIAAFEEREGVEFPADFRLFLSVLGCTVPECGGAGFHGRELVLTSGPGFYDWSDAAQITGARERLVGGLLFDVEHDALWLEDWGPRPPSAVAREHEVRKQVAAAPRLAPVFAHRFLVLEPPRAGNPVLSIHQSDAIVYGRDLRQYLLNDLVELGASRDFAAYDAFAEHVRMPLWGTLLAL